MLDLNLEQKIKMSFLNLQLWNLVNLVIVDWLLDKVNQVKGDIQ